MIALLSSSAIVLGPLLGAYNSFKVVKARSKLLGKVNPQASSFQTLAYSKRKGESQERVQSAGARPPVGDELVAAIELNRKEILRMLMYWVVFAVLVCFTRFVEPLVCWFPFYDYCKLAAAVFISVPETKGAGFVFETALAPIVDTYEAAFLSKIWPKLQKQMLGLAQQCEVTIMRNTLDEVSGEELEKCERDMQRLLLLCKNERVKRKQSFQTESSGDGI